MAHGDRSALQAILDHHAALARELDERVAQVLSAAREGVDPELGRAALTTFLADELLPHAAAEEQSLYPAAAADPTLESLVLAMIDEHRALAHRVDQLDTALDSTTLVATAAEIRALFAVHLHKENEYLLPAFIHAGVDLPALLHDTHHLLAHGQHVR
ncbi:MAG: hypothetical protein BGP03_27710 [Pseudonocardia sp. 73-21]|nr:MAG: hypothetical protein BGP03_27710 [Pseudonocardia sp. 73-21]